MIKRFHDLIIKLISVKGLFAITSMVSFIINPNEWTFYLCVTFGALLVVGREYDKLLEILKVIKSR
jgi:hypothetical protein